MRVRLELTWIRLQVPVYAAECAPANIRGALVMQWCVLCPSILSNELTFAAGKSGLPLES
jgi:hypothetical protein